MITEFIRLTSTPSSLFGATKGPLGDTIWWTAGDQIMNRVDLHRADYASVFFCLQRDNNSEDWSNEKKIHIWYFPFLGRFIVLPLRSALNRGFQSQRRQRALNGYLAEAGLLAPGSL